MESRVPGTHAGGSRGNSSGRSGAWPEAMNTWRLIASPNPCDQVVGENPSPRSRQRCAIRRVWAIPPVYRASGW